MTTKEIFILDDNDEFRSSIAWMLEGMGYAVHDFSDPDSAAIALDDCGCESVLMLDIRMPGVSGLEFHDRLNEQCNPVPIIYMTGHGDVSLAVEAMKKGAVTFLEKPLNQATLDIALEVAFREGRRRKAIGMEQNKVSCFQTDLKQLTPRETEIMYAIVEGKANKVIAYDLGISIKTVELHRSRVMKKLPVRTSQELVKLVMLCM